MSSVQLRPTDHGRTVDKLWLLVLLSEVLTYIIVYCVMNQKFEGLTYQVFQLPQHRHLDS